jgi:hypothetical protein
MLLSFSLRFFVCDVNDDVPTIMDSGEQLAVVVLILPRQPVLVTTLKPVHGHARRSASQRMTHL